MKPNASTRSSRTALLVLDLISDYEYPGGETILPSALRIARRIAYLKKRARRRGIPVIYVNDTRGHWESDQMSFVRRCLDSSAAAAAVIETILPATDDYFMFKPRHSAFFATPLDELLNLLRVRKLILTGITTHQCVLFTAVDAHVLRYELTVAPDCVAAGTTTDSRHALFVLEHATDARLIASRYIRFGNRST